MTGHSRAVEPVIVHGWEFGPGGHLTPGEVVLMLGVARTTVQRWANAGKLASVRTLGGQRRFSRQQVDHILGGLAVPGEPGPHAGPLVQGEPGSQAGKEEVSAQQGGSAEWCRAGGVCACWEVAVSGDTTGKAGWCG